MRAWEKEYEAALRANPLGGVRALLAYNSVIDKVRAVDDRLLKRLRPPEEAPPIFAKTAEDLQDLAEGLCYSISNGLALEVICSPSVIHFLDELGGFEDRPGGQVVTVARLLSDFDAARVLVHPDRFSWEVASLYQGSRAEVSLQIEDKTEYVQAEEFHWECTPEVHYILEYSAGLSFGGSLSPRANRVIAAPQTKILFHGEWEGSLPFVGREVDVFFIAGLNHMGEDYEGSFDKVREHIHAVKAANQDIIVHLEITSVPDLRKREAIVDRILPLADSIGVNEAELADFAFLLGVPRWEEVRRSAARQLEALHLLRALGVKRVNMHTLGYYMTLSPNPASTVRNALLFAALIGAARANGGRPLPQELPQASQVPLSARGLKQLGRLSSHLNLKGRDRQSFLQEGSCEEEENLVAVPTKVVKNPVHTVGLGDVISGASLFAERQGHPQG